VQPAADSPHRLRGAAWIVAGLLLLFVFQCAWFIRTQSFTNDESDHIIAGLDAWKYGEFERWHDHPPLARLWFSLPMLGTNWKYENRKGSEAGHKDGSRIEENLQAIDNSQEYSGWYLDTEAVPVSPAPEVWLYRARSMNVVLGVILLLSLWIVARRMFSAAAATFMLALAVLSPELIAHFSVATTDGASALFLFLAVVQLMRWRHNPSLSQTLLLGLVLGLTMLSKFSSLPLCFLALFVLLISEIEGNSAHSRWPFRWNPLRWNWKKLGTVLAVIFLTIWTGYFFHVSKVVFANGIVNLHFAGYTKLLTYPLPFTKNLTIFIPACEFLTGFGMVFVHNMEGHHSFFLGQISPTGGWKMYFPVAVLLKWPILILLTALIGALALLRKRFPRDLLLMTLFPAVFFAMACTARIDIGVRHLLPVYPFLLLYAAAAWKWIGSRWIHAGLLLLVCLQCADTLRYAPGYLSYFNVFIRPSESYRYLSDSNLDWGQGLVALRQYQAKHPSEQLHLAYFGMSDPAWYGIHYTPLAEGERASGTVVVSATHLSGQLLDDPKAYHWLFAYPRKTILDHSLYVFEVPAGAVK
jgi:hypothetical protein